MKAIIFSHLYNRGKEIFADSDIEFIVCPQRSEENFLSLQKQYQAKAVVLDSRPYSEKFFHSLLSQTLIVRFGTGVDNIPQEICRHHGHCLANTPGSSTTSVCEYVFTTMGIWSQGIWAGHQELIQGRWTRSTGKEIRGQKLAVLGLGRIGQAVAEIAQRRYEMEVVGLVRKGKLKEKKNDIQNQGHIPFFLTEDLQEAISDVNFITLHLNLNSENEYLINYKTLAHCKPQTFLINTSRGKHIQEIDLRLALHRGILSGAALDVFTTEPYPHISEISPQHPDLPPLTEFPNVILTPHIAGHTQEANLNTAKMVIENIRYFYQKRWNDVHWVIPKENNLK